MSLRGSRNKRAKKKNPSALGRLGLPAAEISRTARRSAARLQRPPFSCQPVKLFHRQRSWTRRTFDQPARQGQCRLMMNWRQPDPLHLRPIAPGTSNARPHLEGPTAPTRPGFGRTGRASCVRETCGSGCTISAIEGLLIACGSELSQFGTVMNFIGTGGMGSGGTRLQTRFSWRPAAPHFPSQIGCWHRPWPAAWGRKLGKR